MDKGTSKSRNEILERAEQERSRLIEWIDECITNRLPSSIRSIQSEYEVFSDMANKMGIRFNASEDAQNRINSYIENLTQLKKDLEALIIDEEAVVNGSPVLDRAQKIEQLFTEALEKDETDYTVSCKNSIIEEYNKRKELEAKIAEAKMQRSYSVGRLDSTKRKKIRMALSAEIEQLDSRILELEGKLEEYEFQDSIKAPTSSLNLQEIKNNRIEPVEEKEP